VDEHSFRTKSEARTIICNSGDSPRTIALNPAILSEDEAVELFTEVLNHIVALRFTVYKQVQVELFLDLDIFLDLLLNEFLVFGFSDFALAELCMSSSDLFV